MKLSCTNVCSVELLLIRPTSCKFTSTIIKASSHTNVLNAQKVSQRKDFWRGIRRIMKTKTTNARCVSENFQTICSYRFTLQSTKQLSAFLSVQNHQKSRFKKTCKGSWWNRWQTTALSKLWQKVQLKWNEKAHEDTHSKTHQYFQGNGIIERLSTM